MIKYLEEKGWIVKNGSAYMKKDTNLEIPYHMEGTYILYIEGTFDESVRGDN
jgi:hypothetical protein